MNELKATPGPWVAEIGETYSVRAPHGGMVAQIHHLKGRHGMGGRLDPNEAAANAALIAAAPALDNDLKAMCALWVSVCNAQGWDPNHVVQYGNALATLKKARGE